MNNENPVHPIEIWKRHLPCKLIPYNCFKCKQSGWIPDWIFQFQCKKCGQWLQRIPQQLHIKTEGPGQ